MQTLEYLNSKPTLYINTTHIINLSFPNLLTFPLSLGSKRSQPSSWMSYFTMNSFIIPLFGYHTLTSQLYSNISASVLSLILYQLVVNFTCNFLTQLIWENTSLLAVIPFTSIKNMTKRSYPLTNPPPLTLPLKF